MQQPVVRVGEWLVTPSVNQISRKGRQLTLEPRLIDLLVFFAHHPEEVLSRDELIDNVWTRGFVTDHVVTQSISELRKSLKDGNDNSPKYIATVPKRGYKLTVPVVWCTKERDELIQVIAAETPTTGLDVISIFPPSDKNSASGAKEEKRKRKSTFIVWAFFLLTLCSCVALVALSSNESHEPVVKTQLLLNPLDVDIRLLSGNTCNNWSSQHSYAIGLGSLITTTLNTCSTFMVHDKTNYSINEPSGSGKTLTIGFVSQRHYRAQQCFMSVKMVDNADGSIMMDKRYFVTSNNQLSIQHDLLSSLSDALKQPWSLRMQEMLKQYQPSKSIALTHFYQAHQLFMNGDVDSLAKASTILDNVTKQSPEFIYAWAEKALVDELIHSEQTLDDKKLAKLYNELNRVNNSPGIKKMAIFYQVKTVDALSKGEIDEAYRAINTSIGMETSWMNYVLLGKIYEIKGDDRDAADAYLMAFNLRPGNNTFYWIKNTVFKTSINRVAPYLDKFIFS